jgi:hypothetical protein
MMAGFVEVSMCAATRLQSRHRWVKVVGSNFVLRE